MHNANCKEKKSSLDTRESTIQWRAVSVWRSESREGHVQLARENTGRRVNLLSAASATTISGAHLGCLW